MPIRITTIRLRLRDGQWERIREYVPEEHSPDNRQGRTPVRRGSSWQRCSGYWTPVRSGTCCPCVLRIAKSPIGGCNNGVTGKSCERFSHWHELSDRHGSF